MKPSPQTVTQWLIEWGNGDEAALSKRHADHILRAAQKGLPQHGAENPGHTLQTTALIHEVYIRLAEQKDKKWENRSHFFAVAAQAMRHILVDYARSRKAACHGGASRSVSLEEAAVVSDERTSEIVALDDALEQLAELVPSAKQDR